jgi:mRNA interferase RelE/StbE
VARYRLLIKPSALREIEAIPQKSQRQRVVARIGRLAGDPRPPGCEKLSGHDRYRVRQGAYRIVYAVADADVTVYVVKVGHRSSVYRGY